MMQRPYHNMDLYTRRDAIEAHSETIWTADNECWRLVKTDDGAWFVLDCRYPWSVSAISVKVAYRPQGAVWLFRGSVPAYVRRVCERLVPAVVPKLALHSENEFEMNDRKLA